MPRTERTSRRAVTAVKASYRRGQVRVHRPWVIEPGMWCQYDFGDGPLIDGVRTTLFCAWSRSLGPRGVRHALPGLLPSGWRGPGWGLVARRDRGMGLRDPRGAGVGTVDPAKRVRDPAGVHPGGRRRPDAVVGADLLNTTSPRPYPSLDFKFIFC